MDESSQYFPLPTQQQTWPPLPPPPAGAAAALPEAAGVAAAADGVGGGEAAEAEGARGEPGGQAEEDPCHAGPGGLQQGHQREPVYVPDAPPPPSLLSLLGLAQRSLRVPLGVWGLSLLSQGPHGDIKEPTTNGEH